MLRFFYTLLKHASRDKPVELKPGVRYRVTLDVEKLRTTMPGGGPTKSAADANNWLMTMGLTPTTDPKVWKAEERQLRRVPKSAIIKAEAQR